MEYVLGSSDFDRPPVGQEDVLVEEELTCHKGV